MRILRPVWAVLAIVGAVLTSVNVLGSVYNFNDPARHVPAERPDQHPRSMDWVQDRLSALRVKATRRQLPRISVITQLLTVVHGRMVSHYEGDQSIHHMNAVHFMDNWLLWAAGRLDPAYRDYTFIDSRRALWRGIGLCGQKVVTLVDLLTDYGFRAGALPLHNHVVAWVEIEPLATYAILDPDYGVWVPADLPYLKSHPDFLLAAYADVIDRLPRTISAPGWEALHTDARAHMRQFLVEAYGKASPDARQSPGSGSRVVEDRFYRAKWAVPLVLMGPWLLALLYRRRAGRQ